MDTMTVKAEISEADVIKIKPGMEVEFTILGDPKRVFKSTLKKIAPAPQSASSSSNTTTSSTSTAIYYNAEFDVPNDDRVLRVSMTAECSIILAQKKDVLIVPITAVKTDHRTGKSYAMVLRKGGPQRVDVELGLRDPVSYTHLDVYKRQEYNTSVALEQLICAGRPADCSVSPVYN